MEPEVVLYIDTSKTDEVKVGIDVGGEKDLMVSSSVKEKAQATLSLIDKILEKYNLQPEDIDRIEVNCGPGSFTGLRVGVSIANTLGTFLNISVNQKKPGELVLPVYN